MSSLLMHFEIVGGDRYDRFFADLEHIPDDFRPVFEQMAEDFWEQEETIFGGEGPGWRPLSPEYAAWKARHFPGKAIMERTGSLKSSLTGNDNEDSVFLVYSNKMEIGTTNPYAIYHQTGSIKVTDHPPKRKVMTISDELKNRWGSRLHRWIHDQLENIQE